MVPTMRPAFALTCDAVTAVRADGTAAAPACGAVAVTSPSAATAAAAETAVRRIRVHIGVPPLMM
jgi:hypothetical protein